MKKLRLMTIQALRVISIRGQMHWLHPSTPLTITTLF